MDEFILCEAYAMLGAFWGAKLLYLWVSREMIDWSRFFEFNYFNQLMRGGFVFYGGLIGGILGILLGCKIHKVILANYIGLFAFLAPFVHAFGRIGCFCAGCCYGRPYDGIFSVTFPKGCYAPAGIPLFPVQLLESLLLFFLSLVVLLIFQKSDGERSAYAYFIGYSVIRFLLEFLRNDPMRGKLLWLSTSQWISICIFLLTIFMIIRRKKRTPSL